jgi:hypothetical protein
MRNRGLSLFVALFAVTWGTWSARAVAQDSLADRFPADAIVYVETDTHRLVDGALALDLVSLLDEAQVQEFLQPIASELPAPPSTKGLRQLIESVPWRNFVDGRVQAALRGLRVEIGDQAIEISPSQPLSAKQVNQLGGMTARALHGGDERGAPVVVTTDFVACIDGGDGLEQAFEQHVRSLGTSERTKIGGRDATTIRIPLGGDHAPMQVLHVVRDGNRWWIGGSRTTLERCLGGAAQDSLARSKPFQRFKQQASGGEPALLAYVNVANAGRIFERLVPPIVKEEAELFGFTAIESFGLASTFVEGGVRDSVVLTYDAPPKGFVSLLSCTGGGLEFLSRAPAESGFYFGARLDAEAFVDKLLTVGEELFPGCSAAVQDGLAQANHEIGMDLRQELLPAFGNEIGVYLTPPGAGGLIPEGMVLLKIGDREQFEKVLASALQHAAAEGVQTSEIKSMPEGTRGWAITIPGAGFQPVIAVTQDLFCIGRDAPSLKKALREGARPAERSLVANASAQKVLKSLTGAPDARGLSLLGFVDLQKLVEIGYQFAPMLAGQMEQHGDGPKLDFAALPEPEVITRHFSGLGVAGRCDDKGMSLSFFTPTGLITGGVLAAPMLAAREVRRMSSTMETAVHPPAPRHEPAKTEAAKPGKPKAEKAKPEPTKPESSKARPLSELFAAIEKATGATIDFPADLGEVEVAYVPRSADLDTLLKELGKLGGFTFEVRDVDGEKLVVVKRR